MLNRRPGAVAKAKEVPASRVGPKEGSSPALLWKVTPQLMVELEKLVPPYAAALVQQLCEHLSSGAFPCSKLPHCQLKWYR